MFEVGFTEIVLILGLALLVLGPEKLPGLAQKVGRWTGRARSMARQLRAQLEQEVTLEELAKTRAAQKAEPPPAPPAPEPYMEPEAYSPPHPPHDIGQEMGEKSDAAASTVEPAIHTHAAAVDDPAPAQSGTDPAKTHG
jgi:sec-independent protein translocase protein TatB